MMPETTEERDANRVTIRCPFALSSTSQQSGATTEQQREPPPTIPFLTSSPWNVTYSTLPMWKSKRNVRITYRLISPSSSQQGETETCLDDLVTYQNMDAKNGSPVKQIHGIDRAVNPSIAADSTPTSPSSSWAWKWRGSGWLKIASSQWEILAYGTSRNSAEPSSELGARIPQAATGGEEQDGLRVAGKDEDDESQIDWAVTYFAKTLFTPAGIDVYSRPKAAVSSELLERIKNGLKATGHVELARLSDELFLVQHDE